ncbi:glyoxalase 3 [Sarocladium implicatum]|nr:glyoxalase 3 [Sarocladium implicatum]
MHHRNANPGALPRRALIAITGATAPLGKSGDATGLFISEALHPYIALRAAGFEVDLSSETGSYTPDALSQTEPFLNGEDLEIWKDVNSDFRKKLDNMPKASELDPSKYGLFYASAGHAALIDYPTATNLQRVASSVWTRGGVVASVCHGAAIFANVTDENGDPIVRGKRIAGFSNAEEEALHVMGQLRTWNVELVEELAARVGATYESGEPWADFHIVDGRLCCGQNPQSATSTAKDAIRVFDSVRT